MGRSKRPRIRITLDGEKELKIFQQLAEELNVTPAQFIRDAAVAFVNDKLTEFQRLKEGVGDERTEINPTGADAAGGSTGVTPVTEGSGELRASDDAPSGAD